MATARCILVLCILTGTQYLARLDVQKFGAAPTDCLEGNNVLTVSDVSLTSTSPKPSDSISPVFTINNPSNETVTLAYIDWTISFPTPLSLNQSISLSIDPGGRFGPITGTLLPLNQTYNSGAIPYQLVFYRNFYTEVACWTGSVNVTAPPNPSDCLGDSQLIVSGFTISPSSPLPTGMFYPIFYLTNPSNTTYIYLDTFSWTINFNIPVSGNQSMYGYDMPPGTKDAFWSPSNSMPLNQIYLSGWISYQLVFYSDHYKTEVACLEGSMYAIAPQNPLDCLDGYNELNLSSVTLHPNVYNQSYYLTFKAENERNKSVSFEEISWTITFDSNTDSSGSLSFKSSVHVAESEAIELNTESVLFPHNLKVSWYQYQVFFSTRGEDVVCWEGYQLLPPSPPSPSDCLGDDSPLTISNVTLNPSSPQINDQINLTFTIENESGRNLSFNDIYWTVTFSDNSPITYNLTLPERQTLVIGESRTFTGNNVALTQYVSEGWYPYKFVFYDNYTTEIACWGGGVEVLNSSDCFGGNSPLIVSNVILNPFYPHINYPFNLSFTIQSESNENVAFTDIYWTLAFNTSSPITSNLALGTIKNMIHGTSLKLTVGNIMLNQSVSAGTYSYQFVFYSRSTTEVACWAGDVIVPPNPYDCSLDGESPVNISNVILTLSSPDPVDEIYFIFDIINPSATTNATVYGITVSLNFFSTIFLYEQWKGLVISAGTTYDSVKITSPYPMLEISGWISYTLEIYIREMEKPVCLMGCVAVTTPPNPTDCLGGSQLNVSAVTLYPNSPRYGWLFYVTFEVENEGEANVTFDEVIWTLYFSGGPSFAIDQNLSSAVTVVAGGSQQLNGSTVMMYEGWDYSWYAYQFNFTNNANQIACWEGYEIVIPSPPNPSDCMIYESRLSVSNVTLNPSSPQINDQFDLTFTVENEIGGNLTFKAISLTLTVNASSSIMYTVTLPSSQTLVVGGSSTLTESNVTFNQSASAGTYPYQFLVYSELPFEIACWVGNVTIPSPNNPSPNPSPNSPSSSSSYIYFLGLAGLSILFLS